MLSFLANYFLLPIYFCLTAQGHSLFFLADPKTERRRNKEEATNRDVFTAHLHSVLQMPIRRIFLFCLFFFRGIFSSCWKKKEMKKKGLHQEAFDVQRPMNLKVCLAH